MAKVTYKSEPNGSDETTQFGYDFKGGNAVEVENETHLRKFRGNPFFEVSDDTGIKGGSTNEPAWEAVHRGRGVYAIMKGEEAVKTNLTKEDADAFNSLSDEEKAEYLKD